MKRNFNKKQPRCLVHDVVSKEVLGEEMVLEYECTCLSEEELLEEQLLRDH